MVTKVFKRSIIWCFAVTAVCFKFLLADGNYIPELPSLGDELQYDFVIDRNLLREYTDWFNTYYRNRLSTTDIRQIQASSMKMYMNTSVDPCEDFYEYSCGNWENYNPIPQTKSRHDNFRKLRDIILQAQTELLINENTRDPPKIDSFDKAMKLYRSCVNFDQRRVIGVQPLLKFIDALGGWPVLDSNWNANKFDWVNVTARLNTVGKAFFIKTRVSPDLNKSDENVQYLGEMSIWPNKNVFLNGSEIVNHLTDFRASIMEILGVNREVAVSVAREILVFETNLANITSGKVRNNAHTRLKVQDLHSQVPQIDWTKFLTIVQGEVVDQNQLVIVMTIDYMNKLIEVLSRTEPRTIANYIMMKITESYSSYLDDSFDETRLKFIESYAGISKQKPVWYRCLDTVDKSFGLLIGSLFIRTYFNADSKADVTVLTKKIIKEFQNALNSTTWLDERTKEYAMRKASVIDIRVGYPEIALSNDELNMKFEDLNISSTEYFQNKLNIAIFEFKRKQNKLGKKPIPDEWQIDPHKVNAYYKPNANQLVVPAGILQPPFYHIDYPEALKYGGIGFLIGHETTHGFDTWGSQFDIDGNVRNWWSFESEEAFKEEVKCFVAQYSNYSIKGYTIDGEISKGENIADNGGLTTAFKAYSRWLDENANTADIQNERLPGLDLNSKQLFFLTTAQMWCGVARIKSLEIHSQAKHVPGQYRVMGMFSNSEDFSREFNCQLGSKMNPIRKCKIW